MKIKKILGTVISAAMCLSMIAFNTSAVSDNEDVKNAASNTTFNVSECLFDYGDIDLSSSKIEKIGGDISEIVTYADGESWRDSMTVRTRPTGSNTTVRHVLTSQLGADVYTYTFRTWHFATYTNHNGTYSNVDARIVAPGTYFGCYNRWYGDSSKPNSNADPAFGLDTPRALTEDEILTLVENNYAIFVVYNPSNGSIIDFYSVLNPLIASEWSIIKTTGETYTDSEV